MPLLDQRSRQTLGKEPIRNQFPLTFEQLGQRYGFVLYETTVAHSISDPAFFSIPNIGDRAIVLLDDVSSETVFFILHLCHCCCCFIQCVPLATEPSISLIILPLMRILQRNSKRTTETFPFISHTTNVLLFKFRCNIFIGVRIIKEMPGSVASGTHCIYIYIYIQGVPGGKDLTSGECSLGQTVPI